MAAKNPSASSPLTKLLPIGIIAVVVIGVILYFVMSGGSKAPAPTAKAPAAAPGAAAPAPGAAPAAEAPLPELSPQQLLKEASTAMSEKRYVSPPGNNAFEYYERLLEKEPTNQTATDALRETFPMVIGVPEQEINAGNIDEAARVINLLAKADPNNYTLTILRSKLDAKKKQTEREQAQQAAAAAAAAARTQAPATAAAPAPAAAAPSSAAGSAATETASAPPPSSATASRPAAPATAAATPAPAPAQTATAPPAGETHGAEVLRTAAPDYPPDAVRKRQEGWVEVEFTVQPDGSVANASVVSAQPARVFNTSALRAVERWTFKPAMENGKPVEEKMRRRIEFKF